STQIILPLKEHLNRPDIHWTLPENLHLTLEFIAALKISDRTVLVKQVQNKMQDIHPFYLKLSNLQIFYTSQKHQILSLSLAEGKNILHLSNIIKVVLSDLGYAVSRRSFIAHVTLGKVRNDNILLNTFEIPALNAFLVKEVTLFQSERLKERVLYTPISIIHFSSSS
ncbi:MAG: RNA 2',3'-cyclic phosphodiesterase, partial [Gammaproteobacteria bacterium]|nr:RNA 2',3'-cyclic phosphodiesterase [Gammaproteobacteria bacterium]